MIHSLKTENYKFGGHQWLGIVAADRKHVEQYARHGTTSYFRRDRDNRQAWTKPKETLNEYGKPLELSDIARNDIATI
jgi:hypothetical protein